MAGAGVNGLKVGDRVFCGRMMPCGECSLCRAGHGALCLKGPHLGTDTSGGLDQRAAALQGATLERQAARLTGPGS